MGELIELSKVLTCQAEDECPLFAPVSESCYVEVKAEGENVTIMATGFECAEGWRVTYPKQTYTRDDLCAYCSEPFSYILDEIDAQNREGVLAVSQSEIYYALSKPEDLIGAFALHDETATSIIRCLMDGIYFIRIYTA